MLKIAELADRSGVPIPTLKHYLREGLIRAAKKTGRTMSWYDEATVARVRAIKELQERQYLPLDLIKRALASETAPDELAAANAIADVLAKHRGARTLTRAELIERGVREDELTWLQAAGLAVPTGPEQTYAGDDLAILQTLGAARRAGISPAMLPLEIVGEYVVALRRLVDIELRMFRAGVLAKANREQVAALTTVATEQSERLVVLLRRKLLLPTLQRLIMETHRETDPHPPRPRRVQLATPRRRTRHPTRRAPKQ